MPDQLLTLVGIAGIIAVGVTLTLINLIKGAGQFIAVGLLVFLGVIMLNRTLFSPEVATVPSNPPAQSFPNPTYPGSQNFPGSQTNPNIQNPGIPNAQNPPLTPDQRPRSSVTLDSISEGISRFARTVFSSIDEFVYGSPYAVEPPSSTETAAQPLLPEQQGYQIRPDGVPSRVSTLVPGEDPGAGGAGNTGTVAPQRRPVSAWW